MSSSPFRPFFPFFIERIINQLIMLGENLENLRLTLQKIDEDGKSELNPLVDLKSIFVVSGFAEAYEKFPVVHESSAKAYKIAPPKPNIPR